MHVKKSGNRMLYPAKVNTEAEAAAKKLIAEVTGNVIKKEAIDKRNQQLVNDLTKKVAGNKPVPQKGITTEILVKIIELSVRIPPSGEAARQKGRKPPKKGPIQEKPSIAKPSKTKKPKAKPLKKGKRRPKGKPKQKPKQKQNKKKVNLGA